MNEFRYEGNWVDRDGMITGIYKTIAKYPFEDELFYSKELSMNPDVIKELIIDGAVLYIKENPRIFVYEALEILQLNSKYVDDLEKDDRINVERADLEKARELLRKRESVEHQNNIKRKKLELAQALNSSMNKNKRVVEEPTPSTQKGFYYINKRVK